MNGKFPVPVGSPDPTGYPLPNQGRVTENSNCVILNGALRHLSP